MTTQAEEMASQTAEAQGVTEFSLDEILEDLIVSEEKPETFPVRVGGHDLFFRYPTSYAELRRFREKAVKFVTEACATETAPNTWKPILAKLETEDKIAAFTISYWSAEPRKISQFDALRLCTASQAVLAIMEEVDKQHTGGLQGRIASRVLAKKKPLNTQQTGEDALS